MKKVLYLLSSQLFFINCPAQTPNSWQQKQSLGVSATARDFAIGFSIGTKGYMGTGRDGLLKNDFWEYDPATNVWTQKANFGGVARFGATGFSIGTKGYIGTGSDDQNGSTNKNDFWEYNPATNTWAQKANFGGVARTQATGFSIGSKGYIGTGYNGNNWLKDFWEYDPATDKWTQKADFGGGLRNGATGFSIGTKGYMGTGYDGSNLKNDFWEYDPATNKWAQKANFEGGGRRFAAGFSISNKGFIGTGFNSYYSTSADLWQYDPATNVWIQKANLNQPREGSTSFSIGSKGYISTGNGGQLFLYDLLEYDPSADAWAQKANFGGASRYGATGFSIGSKGYMGTGNNGAGNNNYKNDFWEYNPASNVWTQKANFAGVARIGATGFSIGNKGYIGTGYSGSSLQNDFWEYDPATNTWAQKAGLPSISRVWATGFSIGNKGYIGTGGGWDYPFYYYKDFWEYDPATDTWTQKADFGGTERTEASGFSIGSKGYIGTGYDGNSLKNDFWEYNPATDTWAQKNDFGGTARTDAIGFSIGNKGYMGTGYDAGSKNDFWEYNPATNTWVQKADFDGGARSRATGFSIGSYGYIGFGYAGYSNKNDWWQYTPADILPLQLISFTAKHTGKTNELQWATSQEVNNSHFEIERSINGSIFTKIGTAQAKGGSTQNNYGFTDFQPLQANNYYRLKLLDKDGTISYSKTVLINITDDNTIIVVYPIPVKSMLYIQTNNNTSFSLLNQAGKMLLKKNINGKSTINVSGIACGLYYLRDDSTGKINKIIVAR